MAQVSMCVRCGSASVSVRVLAESVERAMSGAGARFPVGNMKVLSSREPAGSLKSISAAEAP